MTDSVLYQVGCVACSSSAVTDAVGATSFAAGHRMPYIIATTTCDAPVPEGYPKK